MKIILRSDCSQRDAFVTEQLLDDSRISFVGLISGSRLPKDHAAFVAGRMEIALLVLKDVPLPNGTTPPS